jgi:hypothetical protein
LEAEVNAIGQHMVEDRSTLYKHTSDPALEAIRAMGKSALPFVLQQLRGMNSPLHNRMVTFVCRIPGIDKSFDNKRFMRGAFCIDVLRENAADAIPVLIDIADGADAMRRMWAIDELVEVDHHSGQVVPALVEMLNHRHSGNELFAITSLGRLGPVATSAIPQLVAQWSRESDLVWKNLIEVTIRKIDPEAAEKAGIK